MWLPPYACLIILIAGSVRSSLQENEASSIVDSPQRINRRQTFQCSEHDTTYGRSDGNCNNFFFTTYGSAGSEFQRLKPAYTEGGVPKPRTTGADGSALPSAREVSLKCHPTSAAFSEVSLMVMQWGQFVSHDISLAPKSNVPAGTDCCTSSNSECFSIPLSNDPYFTGRTCLDYVRSLRKVPAGATVEEQVNSKTAFIDGSQVYGNSAEETEALRGANGELKEKLLPQGKYLPQGDSSTCTATGVGEYCFKAGDERVNEEPGLSIMHIIWMREHNRIARILKPRHPDWDSNRLFTETRRIVVGKMQAITYNEFLPKVLGHDFMTAYSLYDSTYTYNMLKKPNVYTSFSTAAMRFFHSTVPEEISVNGQSLQYKDLWGRPAQAFNNLDAYVAAEAAATAMAADRYFSYSVSRHYQETAGDKSGLDLVAYNIQHGRDHSLPPYTTFRLLEKTTLGELFANDPGCQSVYKSIDDVDLYTGGSAEPPVKGGIVGYTFAHIMASQFSRLKDGDRHHYLNPGGPQAFTQSQRDMFKKALLAKVICDNTGITHIQYDVFRPPHIFMNPQQDCNQLPHFDLNVF